MIIIKATNKISKYSRLTSTYMFYQVVIKTVVTWHQRVAELVKEIGRRTKNVTD